MAYIKPEQVKSIRNQIKTAYPRYKWSVTRRHHTTVVIVLQESDLPFDNIHAQINPYCYKESEKLDTKTKMVVQHVLEICNGVEACYNRNAGDPYADYGDNTYFIDIDIGLWDKPHKIIDAKYREYDMLDQMVQHETDQEIIKAFSDVQKIIGWIPYLKLSIIEERCTA